MIAAIRAAAMHDRPASTGAIRVWRFPWFLVSLLSPVVTLFHEIREMRYLWREPLQLCNTKLLTTLGTEVRTPLREAVRNTLAGLGCLPRP